MKYKLISQPDLQCVLQHIRSYHDAIIEELRIGSYSDIVLNDSGDCMEQLNSGCSIDLRLKKCDHSPPRPTLRTFLASFNDVVDFSMDTHGLSDADAFVYRATIEPGKVLWQFCMYCGSYEVGIDPNISFLFSTAEFEVS